MESIKIKWSAPVVFLFLSGVVLVLSYPFLFKKDFVIGDDWTYHAARMECIMNGLLRKDVPVKIHSELVSGHGYGNGLFYPQIFLYVPAFLRIIGFNLCWSYKIFCAIIAACITISSYFCFKYIFGEKYSALCATFLYAASKVIILNLCLRAAIGEILAAIFVPMIICGLYDLICRGFSKPWIIIIGFIGIVLSHMITLAISIVICFIAVMFNIVRLFKTKHRYKVIWDFEINSFVKLVFSAIFVLSITCFFWLPMIEQMISDKFMFSEPWTVVTENFLSPRVVFGIFSKSRYSLGFPILISIIVCLLISWMSDNTKAYIFIVCGAVLAICTTWLFPWNLVKDVLNPIQFPWRLLLFSSAFFSVGIGWIYGNTFSNKRWGVIPLIILYVVSLSCCFSDLYKYTLADESIIKFEDSIYDHPCTTGAGKEWLPEGVNVSIINNTNSIITERSHKIEANKKGTWMSFEYKKPYKYNYFDVPLIYYKGYKSWVYSSSGKQRLEVVKSQNNGLVRILNPDNLHGEILVGYEGTDVQKLSYIVSIISLIGVVVYIAYNSIQKIRKPK